MEKSLRKKRVEEINEIYQKAKKLSDELKKPVKTIRLQRLY